MLWALIIRKETSFELEQSTGESLLHRQLILYLLNIISFGEDFQGKSESRSGVGGISEKRLKEVAFYQLVKNVFQYFNNCFILAYASLILCQLLKGSPNFRALYYFIICIMLWSWSCWKMTIKDIHITCQPTPG